MAGKTKQDKLASDIYIFADDLAQAMFGLSDEGRYDVCYLVGLDPNAVQWLADANEGYLPFPYIAKELFQKTLGIDPSDSQAPWPPAAPADLPGNCGVTDRVFGKPDLDADGNEVEDDDDDDALPDLYDENVRTQALNLLIMLQGEVYSPATYHETGLNEEIDIQRMLAAIHNVLYDLWAAPVDVPGADS
jgi:hypothetical protein